MDFNLATVVEPALTDTSANSNAQWRDFVTLINGSWRKGAADFIACSRHLIARARDAFNVMVKSKLDFADSVARRLMHIASNETLCSHVNRLPPCWSTLYYVNQLSESALKAAFADGRIHPGLMRKDAIGLKPKKPVTKQTTTETSSVAAPAELNLDWWNGLPLVQRRAFLDLLGRDGLCAVMSTALKADIRDHVLGVIIAGASKSSAFAVDATNKFHVASLCPADKFPACSRYFRPPRPSIRTRWQNRRRSKRPRPKPLSASSRRRPGRSPVSRTDQPPSTRNLGMTNEVTLPPDGGFDNDGFAPSGNNSGRGHDFLRWKAGYGWVDRDGVTAPSPLLAVKVDEILRMWKDDRPTDITEKPLPDPDTLNAQIPVSEWEEGLDGRPRPPWAHYVVVYLVDPETATKYVYAAATVGGHIAVEQLKENVITMRMLRGARVMPLVELSSKPMKTKFKMSERPDFRIISWHLPGGDGGMLAAPTAPQLSGPVAAEVPTATEAKADPISSGPQPKPAINTTLDEMGGAKQVTSREILDDDIPF